jgi:hypothetical protein
MGHLSGCQVTDAIEKHRSTMLEFREGQSLQAIACKDSTMLEIVGFVDGDSRPQQPSLS